MGESELKNKTAKGVFWGGMSGVLQQLISLVLGIFLARLLCPDDYGMLGMIAIFTALANTLLDSGLTRALINREMIRDEDYNSVFWFNIFVGSTIYIILFFCAPLIAGFFKTPELVPISRYSFLGFLIWSFGTTQGAYLNKALMLKQKAIAEIVALCVSSPIAILMAYQGLSYWALATQVNVTLLVTAVVYWMLSPWKPSFKFSFKPVREMLSFGVNLLATNLFVIVSKNIISVILGRCFTKKEVGDYSQANKWMTMGCMVTSGFAGYVSQPVLVETGKDKERTLRAFRKLIRFSSLIVFPAMFGLAFIAPEFITVAITDKWKESINLLTILCVAGAFISINDLFATMIISRGHSNVYMWSNIIQSTLVIILMIMLYPFGITTTVVGYSTVTILWLIVWYLLVRREVDYKVAQICSDIIPFLVLTIICIVVAYFITKEISNIYYRLLLKIIVVAFEYLSVLWICRSATFNESIHYIRKLLQRGN